MRLKEGQLLGIVRQKWRDCGRRTGAVLALNYFGGAVAQLGARLDGIEEVVGSNPIGSTK
jgi:hypothetical protein